MVSIKENPTTKNIQNLKKELQTISQNKNSLILDNELEKAYKYRKQESLLTSKLNKLELTFKNNQNKVPQEDIAQVINKKTSIPIYEILKEAYSE